MKKAHYHVVNEVVDFAKKHKGERIGKFVNAVLRRFLREEPMPLATGDLITQLSLAHSFPVWLVKRWLERLGAETTGALLVHLNTSPVFTVRFNPSIISSQELVAILQKKGLQPEPSTFLPNSLKVTQVRKVIDDTLFRQGVLFIQDEASQIAGLALQPKEGDFLLDACAGIGAKTRYISEVYSGIRVIAMDTDRRRLIHGKHIVPVIIGDATRHPFRSETFDHILLDAPCSSLGIIRKHPEIKWRRTENDILQFSALQRRLLNTLWGTLKKGGSLVYSVCSFEPEETTDLIKAFAEDREFVLEKPLPFLFNNDYFLSIPVETGMDGFFVAKMRKL